MSGEKKRSNVQMNELMKITNCSSVSNVASLLVGLGHGSILWADGRAEYKIYS